ncbi:hypothetical protein M0802_008743 [Mischocyttarus mexicanus]|nr:hypothetical protein M0802_008743 [Mischocyttarus mexicanus]
MRAIGNPFLVFVQTMFLGTSISPFECPVKNKRTRSRKGRRSIVEQSAELATLCSKSTSPDKSRDTNEDDYDDDNDNDDDKNNSGIPVLTTTTITPPAATTTTASPPPQATTTTTPQAAATTTTTTTGHCYSVLEIRKFAMAFLCEKSISPALIKAIPEATRCIPTSKMMSSQRCIQK